MKKLILALALLATSYNAISKDIKKESPVVVLATSHEIFYFKVLESMIGGEVNVFDAAGNQVAAQSVDKRKMIVDFFEMQPGDYTVKVVKGNIEQVFDYHRKAINATGVLALSEANSVNGK
jgi:hypothetical protein